MAVKLLDKRVLPSGSIIAFAEVDGEYGIVEMLEHGADPAAPDPWVISIEMYSSKDEAESGWESCRKDMKGLKKLKYGQLNVSDLVKCVFTWPDGRTYTRFIPQTSPLLDNTNPRSSK